MLLSLSSAWIACTDDPRPDDPGNVEPTPIHVTASQSPALVAFRDGFTAQWQTATAGVTVDFAVHGPYELAVVCQSATAWQVWQYARTPDDETQLVVPCGVGETAPIHHKVTGHALHKGVLYFADSTAASTTDNWDFELAAANGSYDLVATSEASAPQSEQRIAIRRGIAITADLALSVPIDLATEGKVLPPVKFVADPALPKDGDETLEAVVELTTKGSQIPARLYAGPADAAVVAPEAALIATDVQTVTVSAVAGNASRELRRTFRFGDATKVALPPSGITDPVWGIDNDRLSVALPQLPELDELTLSVVGVSGDADKAAQHTIVVTPNYLNDTGLARPVFDTTMPGFKPEWAFVSAKGYTRTLESRHEVDAGLERCVNSDVVEAPPR